MILSLLSRRLACVGMMAIGLLLTLGGTANATLIDSFDTAFNGTQTAIFAAPTMPGNATVNDTTGIIGGQRDMELTIEEGFGLAMLMPGPSGTILQGQGGMDFRARLRLTYDGLTAPGGMFNPEGLGGMALLGTNFLLRAMSTNPITATIRVFTDAGNFSVGTLTTTDTGGVFQDFTLPLSEFDIGGGSGADFTNVGAIQIDLDVTGDAMLGYDLIETNGSLAVAPEPESWALVGLGALGIIGYSQVRRRKARLV